MEVNPRAENPEDEPSKSPSTGMSIEDYEQANTAIDEMDVEAVEFFDKVLADPHNWDRFDKNLKYLTDFVNDDSAWKPIDKNGSKPPATKEGKQNE